MEIGMGMQRKWLMFVSVAVMSAGLMVVSSQAMAVCKKRKIGRVRGEYCMVSGKSVLVERRVCKKITGSPPRSKVNMTTCTPCTVKGNTVGVSSKTNCTLIGGELGGMAGTGVKAEMCKITLQDKRVIEAVVGKGDCKKIKGGSVSTDGRTYTLDKPVSCIGITESKNAEVRVITEGNCRALNRMINPNALNRPINPIKKDVICIISKGYPKPYPFTVVMDTAEHCNKLTIGTLSKEEPKTSERVDYGCSNIIFLDDWAKEPSFKVKDSDTCIKIKKRYEEMKDKKCNRYCTVNNNLVPVRGSGECSKIKYGSPSHTSLSSKRICNEQCGGITWEGADVYLEKGMCKALGGNVKKR